MRACERAIEREGEKVGSDALEPGAKSCAEAGQRRAGNGGVGEGGGETLLSCTKWQASALSALVVRG
jgi:hypothetical protein